MDVNRLDRLARTLASRTPPAYLHSGHFIEATFENWESEYLQMSVYVLFTVYLVQH